MEKKEINQLKEFVKKIGSYKPPAPPKKPEKQPNKKELEQIYSYANTKFK